MYAATKEWLTVQFKLMPCIGVAATGDKTFGTAVTHMCYPEKKVTTVVDREGRQVKSDTRLYVDSTVTMGTDDEILFESSTRPIKAISSFYDGNTGIKDIQVVYL